jgi:hypothetical protein
MRTRSLPWWVVLAALWLLRIVTAAMLAEDAYVHADLAYRYDPNQGNSISQGTLFRWEAGVAAFAALAVLVVFWRMAWSLVAWALAFVVAASALGAVMIYAHYDIGRLGPLPDMYEPFWYGEKTRAAVAEAIATGTAFLGLVLATWMVWIRRRARRVVESHPIARERRAPVRARIRHDV